MAMRTLDIGIEGNKEQAKVLNDLKIRLERIEIRNSAKNVVLEGVASATRPEEHELESHFLDNIEDMNGDW